MTRQQRVLLIAAVILAGAIGAILVVVVQHQHSTYWKSARNAGLPIPVQIETVGTGSVDESVPAEGVAREFEVVILSPLLTGRVARVLVRLGDTVKQGQRLAEMDSAPLLSRVKQAEAQLRLNRQELAINADKAASMQGLFDDNIVDRDDLNTALVNRLRSEQAVAEAEDLVVQASVNLAAAHMDSPVDGRVISVDAYPGSIVRGQTPVLTVARLDPMLIEAPVTEDKIRFVHIGQQAQVSLYAFPGEVLEGKVRWINPTVDKTTRLLTAQIALANPDFRLQPGMQGIVWLKNRQRDVVRVPTIALVSTKDDRAYVFVVDADEVAHIREVRTGIYAEGYIEVTRGLQAGERVVVVGQVGLQDNDKVLIHDSAQ